MPKKISVIKDQRLNLRIPNDIYKSLEHRRIIETRTMTSMILKAVRIGLYILNNPTKVTVLDGDEKIKFF